MIHSNTNRLQFLSYYINSLRHFQSLIDALAVPNVGVGCWMYVRGWVLLGGPKIKKIVHSNTKQSGLAIEGRSEYLMLEVLRGSKYDAFQHKRVAKVS